jgi:hypothetical protein
MKKIKLATALVGNFVIVAVAAYAVGYHNGINTPTVDQRAVEKAVVEAMAYAALNQ